jgi:Cytochrome P460
MLLLAFLAGAVVPACGGSEPEPAAVAPTATETAPPETTTAETTKEATTSEETTTQEAAPPPPKPKAPPGVPGYVTDYRSWTKLNAQPLPPRDADPHSGTKNVYASKPAGPDGRFPNGTIVVKEATRPGADFIGLLAIMRKRPGADPEHNDWVFVEFTRDAATGRYGLQAEGAVCWSCHVGAEETDYVFTAGR